MTKVISFIEWELSPLIGYPASKFWLYFNLLMLGSLPFVAFGLLAGIIRSRQ